MSYAGIVRNTLNGNNHANTTNQKNNLNFFDLHSQLMSIPRINETMERFFEMISKLKTSDVSEHPSIILGFCFYKQNHVN